MIASCLAMQHLMSACAKILPFPGPGWNAFLPEGEVNVAVGYQEVVEKLLPKYGGADQVGE